MAIRLQLKGIHACVLSVSLLAWFTAALYVPLARAVQAPAEIDACDRACLFTFVDSYWKSLLSHDRSTLPLAARVKYTENNVSLIVGQSLWRTVSGGGANDLVYADPAQGTAVLTAVIEESGIESLFLVRLKVDHHKIVEIETLVGRTGANFWLVPSGWYQARKVLLEDVPAVHRSTRKDMIRIADAYFDRLADQSRPMPSLGDRCNRIENGVRTTNNQELAAGTILNPVTARLSCAEQFELKDLRYVNRVRNRRYMMIDEAKGIVLASAIFDHDGTENSQTQTKKDDRPSLMSVLVASNTTMVGEFFKIEDGKIVHLQAIMSNLPYGTKGAW